MVRQEAVGVDLDAVEPLGASASNKGVAPKRGRSSPSRDVPLPVFGTKLLLASLGIPLVTYCGKGQLLPFRSLNRILQFL